MMGRNTQQTGEPPGGGACPVAGSEAQVPKPVEADRLYSVIANLLGKTAASG
jgi:hypothetical protein